MGTQRPRLRRSKRRQKHSKPLIFELEQRQLFATINVMNFGANPNDGNDDRAGIVAAINASNNGDTIFFPASTSGGAYRVSTEISGNTGGVTKSLGGGRIYKGETTFVTWDNGNGDHGSTIQDRSIIMSTGPSEDPKKKNAIFYYRENNPSGLPFSAKFTNLTFRGRGLRMSRPNGNEMVESVIIDNNHFDVQGGGFNNGIEWTTGLRNSRITNNIFHVGGNNGLDGYSWDHVTIANNWFLNPNATTSGIEGMHLHGFFSGSNHLLIEQNYISGMLRMGIEYQYNGNDDVIQDNWYENPWPQKFDDQFAYSIVADNANRTVTTRNTAIMPKKTGSDVYVRIIFELGGFNLNCYDNYTWGGNHVVAVNGSNATGTVHDNHFEEYAQIWSNNGSNHAKATFTNNGPTVMTSFNPDGRIAGSSAPVRLRPLTNHRYEDAEPPPPDPTVPAPPTGLNGQAVSTTQINLNWSDQADDETGYRVSYSTDNVNFTDLPDLPADTTSVSVTGLNPQTPYYFKVVAFNGMGPSAPATLPPGTTISTFNTGVPATPSNLVAVAVGLNRVDLSWIDNATAPNSETAYWVERLSDDGLTWVRMTSSLPIDSTSYTMNSLASGKTFQFRVIAFNGNLSLPSLPSNIALVEMPVSDPTSNPPPPAAKKTRPLFFFGGSTGGAVSPPVTGSS